MTLHWYDIAAGVAVGRIVYAVFMSLYTVAYYKLTVKRKQAQASANYEQVLTNFREAYARGEVSPVAAETAE